MFNSHFQRQKKKIKSALQSMQPRQKINVNSKLDSYEMMEYK